MGRGLGRGAAAELTFHASQTVLTKPRCTFLSAQPRLQVLRNNPTQTLQPFNPLPLKTHSDEQPTLNLTPMIDVIFLLIIFFMAVSRFSEDERSVELQLPQVESLSQNSSPPPRTYEVSIQANGQALLDGQPVSLDELRSRLSETTDDAKRPTAIVRGDKACAYQHIAEVLAVCQEAGVVDLTVSVQVDVARRSAP